MRKILLALDATNLDTNTLDFACYLARLTDSTVTGVFLENEIAGRKHKLKKEYGGANVVGVESGQEEFMSRNELIEKNIALFKEACGNREAVHSIHRDRGIPIEELTKESRFADFLILDAGTSFNRHFEGTPTDFAREVLRDAECPVILAPASFEGIDELIFTYDGNESSVYAIKQFTYLFPELGKKHATILHVSRKGEAMGPEKYNLKEWMKTHYSSFDFEEMEGAIDDKLFEYLFGKKNCMIVMGAYGRSALSNFFRRSKADLVLRTVSQPVLVTS